MMLKLPKLSPFLLIACVGILNPDRLLAQQQAKVELADRSAVDPPANKLVTLEMIEAALELPCPRMDFPGPHPLEEFTKVFETHWAKHLSYEVPFFIDTAEFDVEGVAATEDIGVEGIQIALGTHTCRDALTLIFDQTTDPKLAFQPEAGHLTVTTLAKAESEDSLLSCVYDLSDFIAEEAEKSHGSSRTDVKRQKNGRRKKKAADAKKTSTVLKQFANGGGLGGGGGGLGASTPQHSGLRPDTETLISMILEQTSPPAKWVSVDGEGGSVTPLGQYVVIRQTYRVHRQISELLKELRKAIAVGGRVKTWSNGRQGMGAGRRTGQQQGGGFGGGGMGGGGGYF